MGIHQNIPSADQEMLELIGQFMMQRSHLAPIVEMILQNVKNRPGFDAAGLYNENRKRFLELGGEITCDRPILSDFEGDAGNASGHYFHQDLLVASLIYRNNPVRHIDIGSSIDGFVAHVAAFRKIEVIDVRDLPGVGHDNIVFTKADMMDEENCPKEITDSLSCLHAIEHFGLGRYGDPLSPKGHIKGFNNMLDMLKPNGKFYISFPIGNQNEVHFNAHRVFHPRDILTWATDPDSLVLERFDVVDDGGELHQNIDLMRSEFNLNYGCGIYMFSKRA